MKAIRYQITIRDNGSEDKNIEITLEDLSRKRPTRVTTEALIPAINQLKSSILEDVEREF